MGGGGISTKRIKFPQPNHATLPPENRSTVGVVVVVWGWGWGLFQQNVLSFHNQIMPHYLQKTGPLLVWLLLLFLLLLLFGGGGGGWGISTKRIKFP